MLKLQNSSILAKQTILSACCYFSWQADTGQTGVAVQDKPATVKKQTTHLEIMGLAPWSDPCILRHSHVSEQAQSMHY